MLGAGVSHFCGDASEILRLVGWVLMIVKIVIPLIIIILGLIDLGKAAVSSKPEEIKKSITSLAWRAAGGVLIFFIPSLVMLIFGLVTRFNTETNESTIDYNICKACIISPWNNEKCYEYEDSPR